MENHYHLILETLHGKRASHQQNRERQEMHISRPDPSLEEVDPLICPQCNGQTPITGSPRTKVVVQHSLIRLCLHRYSINSYQTGRSVYLWSFPKFCREEATHHMWRPTQVRNCPFSTRLPTCHGRTPHLHRVVCKVQTICSRPHDPTYFEECPPIHRMDVGSEDSGGGVSR